MAEDEAEDVDLKSGGDNSWTKNIRCHRGSQAPIGIKKNPGPVYSGKVIPYREVVSRLMEGLLRIIFLHN